jgi:hypothetical protein
MGLDRSGVRFLLTARKLGADFSRSVTIGRQSLQLRPADLRELLAKAGEDVSVARATELITECDGFCEPLLRLLGALDVSSIDISAYQGATIIHDMNEPIGSSLANRFSVVLDGGSLEHVFNFPRAIANCMQMVETGGFFLGISPANNFMGHGFYQFSPELYFRVFCPANGFAPPRILVFQDDWRDDQWYEVRDPEELKNRVTLLNRYPTYMLIQARKKADVSLFSPVPQQSDYAAWWADSAGGLSRDTGGTRSATGVLPRPKRTALTRVVPGWARLWYRRWRSGESPFNPAHFRKTFD